MPVFTPAADKTYTVEIDMYNKIIGAACVVGLVASLSGCFGGGEQNEQQVDDTGAVKSFHLALFPKATATSSGKW